VLQTLLEFGNSTYCAADTGYSLVAKSADQHSGLSQAGKPMLIQAFIPELAIEALD